jgi:aryl-alcohol dehydrogenase-like predicted oxidoreductase
MNDGTSVLAGTYPLCLGGNVFGWTIGEEESFAVLDAYVAAGGNFIDTADSYSVWYEGNSGGESETIIGRWMALRGNRRDLILTSKVGQLTGVTAAAVGSAVEASLRRLRTDYIDFYYAHIDDPDTPLAETLGALDALRSTGKVREIGASNYTAERLDEALDISEREGLARYSVIQALYNLLEREDFEGPLQELCVRRDVPCLPFFSLARGFLTGKYRPGAPVTTRRGSFAWTDEWDDRASRVLATLDEVARERRTTDSAVALAWLRAQPGVHAPIASARTVEQLQGLLPMVDLKLTADEVERLTRAGLTSAPRPRAADAEQVNP